MKLAATKLLFDHWSDVKGARSAPERREIEPRAIAGVLADTFVLDFDPSGGFPMRVAGSRTQGLFQREIRGRPFLELWRRADRAELVGVLSGVADEALPCLLGAVGGPAGMERIDFEILLAPLRYNGATHARLLGACAPARAPAWLGLIGLDELALTSLRILRPAPPRRQTGETGREFAKITEISRRNHLIVYSTQR